MEGNAHPPRSAIHQLREAGRIVSLQTSVVAPLPYPNQFGKKLLLFLFVQFGRAKPGWHRFWIRKRKSDIAPHMTVMHKLFSKCFQGGSDQRQPGRPVHRHRFVERRELAVEIQPAQHGVLQAGILQRIHMDHCNTFFQLSVCRIQYIARSRCTLPKQRLPAGALPVRQAGLAQEGHRAVQPSGIFKLRLFQRGRRENGIKFGKMLRNGLN